MLLLAFFLIVAITNVQSSALPSQDNNNGRILYDQRQEGEWNVHADLKNFVFFIIPTRSQSSSSTSTPPGASLLDLLLKSVPKRGLNKFKHTKNKGEIPGEETLSFIESKTAPYHVDISKSRNHLAKLHPEPVEVVNAEEIVIAKSPSIALVKDGHTRTARAFVLTVPSKKDKKKNKEISKMKLLGAENEQCGPGLIRDQHGICRTIKN